VTLLLLLLYALTGAFAVFLGTRAVPAHRYTDGQVVAVVCALFFAWPVCLAVALIRGVYLLFNPPEYRP
jgi:hypothetical protein